MTKAKAVTQAASTTPAPTSDWCRGCWRRSRQSPLQLLPCGDVLCNECISARARAAIHAPAQMLPLRCCQQPVPSSAIAAALLPSELAFYQHLVAQNSERLRQFVTDGRTNTLTTACDICRSVLHLKTATDALKVLACGHVYCDDCNATLRQSASSTDPSAPICCSDLPPLDSAAAASAKITAVPAAPATGEDSRVTARRTMRLVLKGKGKAQAVALAPTINDNDNAKCQECARWIYGKTAGVWANCGHAICRRCVQQRCQRVVRAKEEDGVAGEPVSCCSLTIPIDMVRPMLGKRLLAKYEPLVTKKQKAAPKGKPKGKRKAATTAGRAKAKRPRSTEKAVAVSEDKAADPSAPLDCEACMAQMIDEATTMRGPCGHLYCVTCVKAMAELSLQDRSRVPIRCCGKEFPIDYIQTVLPKGKMAKYERFVAERDWRGSDLTSDAEYAKIVTKLKGKQCPTCGIGIQKVRGCQTMSCPHGHYFCWKCMQTSCACYNS